MLNIGFKKLTSSVGWKTNSCLECISETWLIFYRICFQVLDGRALRVDYASAAPASRPSGGFGGGNTGSNRDLDFDNDRF